LALRVVFVGTGEIGVPGYEALAASGHDVVGVVTQPDRPAGRGLELLASPVKRAALRHHHAIFQPEKINAEAALEQLRYLKPDVLVVCAYGQILRPAVLELPRLACLNLHASLLPRHRGASCIQAALRAGDRETGMTLMWMDRGLDTGDILLAESIRIGSEETAGELHDRLAGLGPALLLKGLKLLEAGQAPRIPQDPDRATYAPKLGKEDGRIDWALSQGEIDRHIRAMTPWPSAFTYLEAEGGRKMLKIFKTILSNRARGRPGEVLSVDSHGILVAAGEGGLLLREVQVEGRARMPAEACARGLRLQPGAVLV
jgi:methionyl-tRNA formyltransferase